MADLVRAHLAVAMEWNPGMDVLWIVQLATAVNAWEGRARSQLVTLADPKTSFMGGGLQVCVPGLTWRQVAVDHVAHVTG